jgi:Ribonuclease G/E
MKDNTAAVHVQVPVEVASFLLNEKRPEIAKIELKQRDQRADGARTRRSRRRTTGSSA